MNALRRLWRWATEEPPLPATVADLKQSYALGHHNGFWVGVLEGRKAVLCELEDELAAQGRAMNQLEPADVARAKVRNVH